MTGPTPDLAALRERIRRLEGWPDAAAAPAVPLGLAAIDRALPGGGLARGAVHELMPPDPGDGAATAFLAVIVGRLAAAGCDGPVLWVSARGDLFAPGVLAYGWRPERLLQVRVRTVADALWVMEDGLRCAALAAVAGDVGDLDFAVTRRLQLAAAGHGVPLLLHRPWRRTLVPSAAATRWRVAAAPAPCPTAAPETGDPVWRLDLVRCRGGRPGHWTVAFDRARRVLYRADGAQPSSGGRVDAGEERPHRRADLGAAGRVDPRVAERHPVEAFVE